MRRFPGIMYLLWEKVMVMKEGLDQTTPRSVALLLSPLPRAAARLMPTQLNKNPANLQGDRPN
jgi:hypothetical protein